MSQRMLVASGKGKETDPPLESPEGNPGDPLILAQLDLS